MARRLNWERAKRRDRQRVEKLQGLLKKGGLCLVPRCLERHHQISGKTSHRGRSACSYRRATR
jgi:hypothetical protein